MASHKQCNAICLFKGVAQKKPAASRIWTRIWPLIKRQPESTVCQCSGAGNGCLDRGRIVEDIEHWAMGIDGLAQLVVAFVRLGSCELDIESHLGEPGAHRSEERRVGRGRGTWWAKYQDKKNRQ